MSDSIPSGQLWQRIDPLLPMPKKSRHVRHVGRKPAAARRVMAGIVFVLETGVPSKDLPATGGSPWGHTCRRRPLEWHERGSRRRLWQNPLSELRAEGRPSRERAVADSSNVRAGHGGEKTGEGPVGRGKLGSKHHLLVGEEVLMVNLEGNMRGICLLTCELV